MKNYIKLWLFIGVALLLNNKKKLTRRNIVIGISISKIPNIKNEVKNKKNKK